MTLNAVYTKGIEWSYKTEFDVLSEIPSSGNYHIHDESEKTHTSRTFDCSNYTGNVSSRYSLAMFRLSILSINQYLHYHKHDNACNSWDSQKKTIKESQCQNVENSMLAIF